MPGLPEFVTNLRGRQRQGESNALMFEPHLPFSSPAVRMPVLANMDLIGSVVWQGDRRIRYPTQRPPSEHACRRNSKST